MPSAIKVENLGKLYHIGARQAGYRTLREAVVDAVAAPFRWVRKHGAWSMEHGAAGSSQPSTPCSAPPAPCSNDTFWALKNVSFDVAPGEVVGIIGRNGAGKSTLLKILSHITEPTEGRVELHGRVSSLLEVGTGFHPELTGRENIFLNAAILGMKKEEIKRKFDEIVAFAEVEKFIDTPVKYYSSGMYVRLAFAVAAHLEPEILLVDEVLAVGDAAFQKKCLGKMGDVAREGRTVLFVSHNMTAVQSLCRRVLLLEQGRVAKDDASARVVADYMAASFSACREQQWPDMRTAPGNDGVRLRRVCVRPLYGNSSDQVTVDAPVVIECEYWNLKPNSYLNISLPIYNQQGTNAFTAAPVGQTTFQGQAFPVGLFRSTCYVPENLLNDDLYCVTVLIVKDAAHVIFSLENALVFEVIDNTERVWHGKWPGALRPVLKWTTERLQE